MQTTMQAVVVSKNTMAPDSSIQLALFNPDGTPFVVDKTPDAPAAAVPDSTATTILGLVSDHNALLASLRAAGVLAT